MYPYSQYIRALNLHDLENLLISEDMTSKVLLQGELEQFEVVAITKHPQLVAVETANKIGEAITKRTPLLEVLTGTILSGALSRWIPRLPQLTHLKTYNDIAIKGNGTLIQFHCPSFKGLDIDYWNGYISDQGLAAFLKELRPQALESFKSSNSKNLGPRSFQALSCHGKSIIDLKLHSLTPSSVRQLSLLKGCTNLVSLSLAELGSWNQSDREKSHSTFLETVAWLKKCTKLRTLSCTNILSAPALMTEIFLESSILLTSLEFEGSVRLYTQGIRKKFHQALANQTSLQSIWLKGDVDGIAVDADGLVESLSNLVNLTDLRLGGISEYFADQHIVQLARSLPKLEICSMSGYGLTDAIWGEFGSLRSLQILELDALTTSTKDGILGFIEKLGPGNKGLVLSMSNVDMDSNDLWDLWEEEDLIQETIAKKIQGRFEFEFDGDPYAEPEPEPEPEPKSESEGESDWIPLSELLRRS